MYKLKLLNSYLLLVLLGLFTVVSCDPDEGDKPMPEGKKEAVIATLRKNTPSGRVYYLGAYDKVPTRLQSDDMLEVGGFVVTFTFENHPYTWNATDGSFTKYNVDSSLRIKKAEVLSLTGYGIQGGGVAPAFISKTKGYLLVLGKGKVFEFNPETMKITKVIDVEPLPDANNAMVNTEIYEAYATKDGKILTPVMAKPKAPDSLPPYAMMGVFDIKTEKVQYVKDDRMSIGYYRFAESNDGKLYYRPSKFSVLAKEYSNPATFSGHPTTGGLLRANPDGTFDSNFFINLDEVLKAELNAHAAKGVVYVYNDYALVQYFDETYVRPADPSNWWGVSGQQLALVNIKTKKAEKLDPFNQLGTAFLIGKINGVPYFGNFGAPDNKYSIIEQVGAKEMKVVGEAVGGSCLFIGKIKL